MAEERKSVIPCFYSEGQNHMNETMKMYAEIISEYLKAPLEDVAARIEHVVSEYHIPVKYYANHKLYLNDNEETLLKHKCLIENEHNRNIERMVEITGMTKEEALQYSNHLYEVYHLTEKSILDGELYKKSEEEIVEWIRLRKEVNQKRIARIMALSGKDQYWVKKHMAKCKAIYGIAMGNYENSCCYKLTDEILSTFANLEDSRYLGKKYITVDDTVLTDKERFNRTYEEFLGRKYWVNRNTTYEDFLSFIKNQKEVFCKPIDLHGGLGVRKLNIDINYKEIYEELISQPKMLLEEVIEQNDAMAEFYEGSINTVRLFTILYKNEFHAFAAFVRFGVDGVADNISAGGIGCGVDERTGEIITPAMGNDGRLFERHPVSGKAFVGFKIPYWKELLDLAQKALRKVDGVDYVGWDFAITKDGVVIVEGNCVPCLSIYQSFFAYRQEGRKYKYERFL